jgi:hypothetical protein
MLGLPSSSSGVAYFPINEHPFCVQPDPKLAAKCHVDYMWQKDDPVFSSLPAAPSKHF